MGTVIDVIWEGGVLVPEARLDLPEKTRLRITERRKKPQSFEEMLRGARLPREPVGAFDRLIPVMR